MVNDRISVLIIEDELIVAKDVQSILELEGYKVLGIANSFQKVRKICTIIHDIDIVICDISLKGQMDGVEIINYLRQHYFFNVIYLSAFSDANTIERTKSQKAQAYIVKPFTPKQLLATINLHKPSRKLLEQKQMIHSLGKRELEICKLMLKGLSEDEIATILFLSKHTIHTHRKNIYRKLNVTKVTDLYGMDIFQQFKSGN